MVCDAKIRDATQKEKVDVVSVEQREPDPSDLRRVLGEQMLQVCSLQTGEVLATCRTFVGLKRRFSHYAR